jgi:hypothetical protein
VPLRPLDANDILKAVFTPVRRYLVPLYLPLPTVVLGSTVLLGACGYIAWELIRHLHLHGERMTTGRLIDVTLAASVVIVPALLCAAFASAVTTAVSVTVLGHRAVLGRESLTVRQAWAQARLHVWRTLGVQLLTELVVLFVFLISALPAVVLGVALHSPTAAAFGLLLLIPGAPTGERFRLRIQRSRLSIYEPRAAANMCMLVLWGRVTDWTVLSGCRGTVA